MPTDHDHRDAAVRVRARRARVALANAEVLTEWEPEDARTAAEAILARGDVPKAIICAKDRRIAFGAYRALANADLRIPTDVSIVSFDDSDLAGWLQPRP